MTFLAVDTLKANKPVTEIQSGCFALGLEDVPDTLNRMDAGHAYALCIKPALNHVGFIASTLVVNLQAGTHCILVTPLPAEAFLDRCDPLQKETIVDAVKAGRLSLLTLIGDCKKNIGMYGVEYLLQEIRKYGAPEGSLLVVDQAEQVFSLHYVEAALDQLNTFHDWLSRSLSTALFVFSGLAELSERSAGYHAVLGKTRGNAALTIQGSSANLWVEFWRSLNGTMNEYALTLGTARSRDSSPQTPPQPDIHPAAGYRIATLLNKEVQQAGDAGDVYYLGDLLAPQGMRSSGRWRNIGSLLEMVHATQDACAATVLITAALHTDYIDLARTVWTIRKTCGPMVRIIILDRERTIRYQNEVLLLRLGANAVTHNVCNLTRLRLLLESLREQLCFRPCGVDFNNAVDCAVPPPTKGFLRAEHFVKQVQEALRRARFLDLPCVLIALNHAPADNLLSSIQRFSLGRTGDLLTACPERCHIFLYGCSTTDLCTLLPRLLGVHDTQSIGKPVIVDDETQMLASLKRIGNLDEADCAAVEALFATMAHLPVCGGAPEAHTAAAGSN